MAKSSLETFRELFADGRVWCSAGKIIQVGIASDGSVYRVKVQMASDEREIIARMGWPGSSSGGGGFFPPSVGDMVLVAFAEADEDTGFVFMNMSSKEDYIPSEVREGHSVVRAKPEKNLYLDGVLTFLGGVNTTSLYLGKNDPDALPAEPLVLGLELQTLLSNILTELKSLADAVASHTHLVTAAPGTSGAPLPPESITFGQVSGNLNGYKSSPVDDGTILSDIVFTEKGN